MLRLYNLVAYIKQHTKKKCLSLLLLPPFIKNKLKCKRPRGLLASTLTTHKLSKATKKILKALNGNRVNALSYQLPLLFAPSPPRHIKYAFVMCVARSHFPFVAVLQACSLVHISIEQFFVGLAYPIQSFGSVCFNKSLQTR